MLKFWNIDIDAKNENNILETLSSLRKVTYVLYEIQLYV
jgi:hypothetical protein